MDADKVSDNTDKEIFFEKESDDEEEDGRDFTCGTGTTSQKIRRLFKKSGVNSDVREGGTSEKLIKEEAPSSALSGFGRVKEPSFAQKVSSTSRTKWYKVYEGSYSPLKAELGLYDKNTIGEIAVVREARRGLTSTAEHFRKVLALPAGYALLRDSNPRLRSAGEREHKKHTSVKQSSTGQTKGKPVPGRKPMANISGGVRKLNTSDMRRMLKKRSARSVLMLNKMTPEGRYTKLLSVDQSDTPAQDDLKNKTNTGDWSPPKVKKSVTFSDKENRASTPDSIALKKDNFLQQMLKTDDELSYPLIPSLELQKPSDLCKDCSDSVVKIDKNSWKANSEAKKQKADKLGEVVNNNSSTNLDRNGNDVSDGGKPDLKSDHQDDFPVCSTERCCDCGNRRGMCLVCSACVADRKKFEGRLRKYLKEKGTRRLNLCPEEKKAVDEPEKPKVYPDKKETREGKTGKTVDTGGEAFYKWNKARDTGMQTVHAKLCHVRDEYDNAINEVILNLKKNDDKKTKNMDLRKGKLGISGESTSNRFTHILPGTKNNTLPRSHSAYYTKSLNISKSNLSSSHYLNPKDNVTVTLNRDSFQRAPKPDYSSLPYIAPENLDQDSRRSSPKLLTQGYTLILSSDAVAMRSPFSPTRCLMTPATKFPVQKQDRVRVETVKKSIHKSSVGGILGEGYPSLEINERNRNGGSLGDGRSADRRLGRLSNGDDEVVKSHVGTVADRKKGNLTYTLDVNQYGSSSNVPRNVHASEHKSQNGTIYESYRQRSMTSQKDARHGGSSEENPFRRTTTDSMAALGVGQLGKTQGIRTSPGSRSNKGTRTFPPAIPIVRSQLRTSSNRTAASVSAARAAAEPPFRSMSLPTRAQHGAGCRLATDYWPHYVECDVTADGPVYFSVLPGLYVGNFRDSKDAAQLREHGITHILAIHDNARKLPCNNDKEHLCILASDSPGQNLTQFFPVCNDFIHTARLKGGAVLIHCLAGMSRSVTVAVIYVMSVTTLNWRDALKAVRGARTVANPNVGFMKQLNEFDTDRLTEERRRLKEKYPGYASKASEDERMAQEFLATYYHSLSLGQTCDGDCPPGAVCPRGLCNQRRSLFRRSARKTTPPSSASHKKK